MYNEKAAKYHYGALVPNLVRERREDAKMAKDLDAPLTFGNVPEKMTGSDRNQGVRNHRRGPASQGGT